MGRLRGYELALGFLFATAFWVILFAVYAQYNSDHNQTQRSTNTETNKVASAKSVDDRLATYTLWLATFTGLLVGVSAFQGFFLYRADKTARIMAETAQAQTAKMGEWADAAEKQMLLTGQQADIQRKQHAVGRLQFLAVHRPRLRVRHVTITDETHKIGLPTFFFSHGAPIKGSLVVVNVGGTKATLVESRYRIYFSKIGLPAAAPYDESWHQLLLPEYEMDVGDSCATAIADTILMEEVPQELGVPLRAFERENWRIYIMGQIRYRDEDGHERFMGFCREGGKDGRFRAVDDADYEYED